MTMNTLYAADRVPGPGTESFMGGETVGRFIRSMANRRADGRTNSRAAIRTTGGAGRISIT
jgi:hypothetical protein